jgi:membrane protein
MLCQLKTIGRALYELYQDSGFAMAGSVAFSFVLSLFPFCIFLGALAGSFGGEVLAKVAVAHLFELVPATVAKALAPEVMSVMSQSRFDLLTVGAVVALFFATSAIESLRAALNNAYRVKETRSYLRCLLESSFFVLLSAVGMLAVAWVIVVGPQLAAKFEPSWMPWLAGNHWTAWLGRYVIVVGILFVQLVAYHMWLAAGRRRLTEVLPGIILSVILWLVAGRLFTSWLTISNYSRFYAGLTQIMSALVFFQLSAMIAILGAELNRGLRQMRLPPDQSSARGADSLKGECTGSAKVNQSASCSLPEHRQRS